MTHVNFFKSEVKTRAEGRTSRAKDIAAARLKAYKAAELRDGLVCRICGRKVRKAVTLSVDRLEHHHINGRGTLAHETAENVCVSCKGCHDERHVKRTLHISGNANGKLRCEQGGKVWFSGARR